LTDLDVTEPTVDTVANNATFELYDFPGDYTKKPDGEGVAKVRMQEQESTHLVGDGVSTCGAFTSGYKFDLKDYYRKDLNQSYVLTVVRHTANAGSSYYTGQAEIEETYENNFTVIPYSVPYRPVRGTPRPIVQGPQPAVVVGPSGEEIYVDKYGRVKVQFFWDREGKADENSSCWIRVSQLWAGKQWGAMWIPRVGQEVIVDFLEGDPDRPLIMGRVYNADEMPPYPLPDEKTKSTIKSYSSKGGGGFNELRFEDKKGKEQVFIHAERNQDVRVKADRMVSIGGTTNLSVGKDQVEKIKGDKHLHVVGDHTEAVDGDEHLKVGGEKHVAVEGHYAMKSHQDIYLDGDMNVVIESKTDLTLKVGSNFIRINASGVTIVGTMVLINSGGAPGSVAPCKTLTPHDPAEADDAKPGEMGQAISFQKKRPVVPPSSYGPQALVLKSAAQSGAPLCEH
jgi:type VI secretion system secreted protein VgrG